MSDTCSRPDDGCSTMRMVTGLGVVVLVIATIATLMLGWVALILAVLALVFAMLYGICCMTDAIAEAVIQLKACPRQPGSDASEA